MTASTSARIAGNDFELDAGDVDRVLASLEPEPLRDHYVVVGNRRYPPKQVLAAVTGLDRADFTTHQARAVLRRLGFGCGRVSHPAPDPPAAPQGPRGGREAELLGRFAGRWVAQAGLEILFDADTPDQVVSWLRRHNRQARVWRIPPQPSDTGSTLSSP